MNVDRTTIAAYDARGVAYKCIGPCLHGKAGEYDLLGRSSSSDQWMSGADIEGAASGIY